MSLTLRPLGPIFLLLMALMGSCSTMRSGHYVKMLPGESVESLARSVGVSPVLILNANRHKKVVPGEWIFVPLKRGIAYAFLNQDLDYYSGPQSGMMSSAFLWPVPNSRKVSSLFGERDGKNHAGIDIPAQTGSAIVVVEDGRVVHSGQKKKGYGNLTIVDHFNGLFTVYAHASKNFTSEGQKVYRGQVIAEIGNTGKSTGPHLHFEVRKGDSPLNPANFLSMP